MNAKLKDAGPSVSEAWQLAAMLATPVRWVAGWMFLSAFWRRVVLDPDKLDPNAVAYVGHKFNHFLPNALWIKPLIQYLLLHLDLLYAFLLVFTVIEGLAGLALLLGIGTRLAGLGVTLLSWGIMLGAGWLGTTCLDEWNIGASGVAAGLTILLAGAGPWSVDSWWRRRWPGLAGRPLLCWLSSGPLWEKQENRQGMRVAGGVAVIALGWALYTNQVFAGGVWGKLHNFSKKPRFTLSQPVLNRNGALQLTLFRDGGPDTYGAFLVEVSVRDASGQVVEVFNARQLAALPPSAIDNRYPEKTRPGPHSLVAPLGSLARLRLEPERPLILPPGAYRIGVTDVSGLYWFIPAEVHAGS